MNNKEINEKAICRQIFLRQFQLMGAMNFTRMQGLNYGWTLAPVLKKIYTNKSDYLEALKRNTKFFNTNQIMAPFIMGMNVSMEMQNAENPDFDAETIESVKVGLMGPLAGIGDSVWSTTWRIICTSLVIAGGQKGLIWAPLVLLLAYNIPNYLCRYYGIKLGFRLGESYITKAAETGLLKSITKAATMVGLTMVGAMCYSMVKFQFNSSLWIQKPVEQAGKIVNEGLSLQNIFDQILLGFIPLCVTLFCLWFVKKKKINANWLILGMVIVCILLAFVGII